MMALEELIDIFTKYGYEQEDCVDGNYVIFVSGTSMYPAAEIVQLDEACESTVSNIKAQYSEAGYAVRICKVKTIEEVEKYLFNLFFQVEESNRRNLLRYAEYTKSIMRSYEFQGATNFKKYEYINIPYSVEYNFAETHYPSNSDIVTSIRNDVNKGGAQLIIVEAGAGFGKTSTAYELLNSYKDVHKDFLPFFMELYNDRIATTFRYLLLSQIDRTFKVRLGSDIVLYNIRRGKIPLIIDGFDELLSKDLDNGQLETKFNKVETMLSTIGELLTDQAKVILTTRKTAIFAGENFYDWFMQQRGQGRNFTVIRYQLGTPSINNWLNQTRISKLPKNFGKISNPVILGYLRYLSDSDFDMVVSSSSLTDHYFNSILKREKQRQELPFNVDEQIQILRHLASYFAGYNANALARTEIKETIYELDEELIDKASTARQDAKSLSNALTNHAFLDRKGDNSIGFINDFIFGTFFMYAIIEENNPFYNDFFKNSSYSFVEKAILAGSICDSQIKDIFWKKLREKCILNPISTFWADLLLKEQPCHPFEKISLDEKSLYGVFLGSEQYPIKKCSFSNMSFLNSIFDFNYIRECTFINCKFIECTKEGQNLDCGFYGCEVVSDDAFIDKFENCLNDEEQQAESVSLELQILGLYFKVDHRTPRMRMISKIRDNFTNQKVFRRAFENLKNLGYILTNGDKSFLSPKGIEYFNQKRK